jgi:hypothetical protein
MRVLYKDKKNIMKAFSDSAQLLQKRKPFQLGTTDMPCEVLFGLHDIDEGNTWRGVKIIPSEADMLLLKDFDEKQEHMQDLVKELDDIEHIKLKVNLNTTKVVNADKSIASLEDLCNERRCKVIVSGRQWKMDGQQGVCLRAHAIQLLEDNEMDLEFL